MWVWRIALFRAIFIREGIEAIVPHGTSVLEAARICGVYLESPCNGNGTCGKCKVIISGETVLACETALCCDTEITTLKSQSDSRTLKILSGGSSLEYSLKPRFNVGYGLAADIGTTTLVVSLINLSTGEEEASESLLNPQTQYAQDVLSRIQFAEDAQGLDTLYEALTQALNEAIRRLAARVGITTGEIKDAVYSGNTTMLHLAVMADPSPLGKYPYTPVISGGQYFDAERLDIGGKIYLPPIISAFVGADITSGILASELSKTTAATLFIDIGTNGEMVLAKDGKLVATSTAAGPAFEGMNISQGIRASNGAIERFSMSDDDTFEFETIGDTEAIGICGSGLLDIAAELVRTGRIGKTGRFSDKSREFRITDKVAITQNDIRQLQLAKGAVRTGIDAMLKNRDLTHESIERVEIAGSFGYHLSERSLLNLKLLPEAFEGKVSFVGNTSQSGGIAFLLNTDLRREAESIVKEVESIELADDDGFQKLFVSSLGF